MLFPPEEYQVVEDIATRDRNLQVIVEADNREEAERYRHEHGLSSDVCAVYKEQGEEFYRLICWRTVEEVKSDSEEAIK